MQDREIVQVRNLTKKFKTSANTDILVVDDVSFSIKEGGFYSLIGPSGCGKTTIIRIIAGIEKSDAGEVTINSAGGEGHVFSLAYQQNDLMPWLTVEDNIRLGLNQKGYDRDKMSSVINSYLKEVGLEKFNKFYPTRLSGGMQKRVSLARALSVNPELLLLDEPFAFLDFQTRLTLHKLILNLFMEEKKSIFFVTHNVPEAIMLSEKIIVFTARPARIKAIVDIPFTYPRNLEKIRTYKDYIDIFDKVSELLKDEISKSDEMERK